jgi:hypothetical protein
MITSVGVVSSIQWGGYSSPYVSALLVTVLAVGWVTVLSFVHELLPKPLSQGASTVVVQGRFQVLLYQPYG